MLGTLLSFCLMAIAARELSDELNAFQIIFFRSVFGLMFISLIMVKARKLNQFKSERLGLHLVRNVFHFMGQYGWLFGISLLPLAEVFALEFTVPLWTAIIASLFLGESLTLRRLFAISLGLLGVVIIVQPGQEVLSLASLTVLGAAFCYAIAHTCTKSLSRTEDPLTILFLMCAIQLPLGLVFALNQWVTPNTIELFWLTIIGITALSAHYCMTKAMHYADVSVVVIMDFMRLPAIGVIGVLAYNETLELSLLIGASIMLMGNLTAMAKPRRKRPTQNGS
ncbi:DMT family transporter [Vibrio amylolyticus]|uniref:DMT family transporter n=1 Tax=Vibrio amylolyticus TaxID=2847292 RepID=UPI00354E6BDD